MKKTLTIKSVKCIKPSSGIDPLVTTILNSISQSSGSVLNVFLIESIGVDGASVASDVLPAIQKIDKHWEGSDDLYIKVNDSKIWPGRGKYSSINSQEAVGVNHSLPLENSVTITLYDYDTISSDDLLGSLTVDPNHQPGTFSYVVQNPAEGSIYTIVISIDALPLSPLESIALQGLFHDRNRI